MKKFFKSIWPILLYADIGTLSLVNSVYASGESEGSHGKSEWFEFAWKTLDFIILVGFLYWLLAAKIKDFFIGRRKEIKEIL